MGDLISVNGRKVLDVADDEALKVVNHGPEDLSVNDVPLATGHARIVSDSAVLESENARVFVERMPISPEGGGSGAPGLPGAEGPQGPKGDKGDRGDEGSRGEQGTVGERGAPGAAGADGVSGEAGPVGAKGDKGDSGQAGPQGLQGPAGVNGAPGAQGPKGDIGAQGLTGSPGIQGVKGDTGLQGLPGAQGVKGDPGIQGQPGAQGIQGPSGTSFVKLTADQIFSTVTPANVTGLAFPVTAGTIYAFEAQVTFRTAALTTGLRIGLTCPAFAMFSATVRAMFAADGVGAEFQGALSSSGDSVLTTAVPAIGTDYVAEIVGTLVPSANGSVQVQAASEVAASAVTIRNGSRIQFSVV